MKLRSQKKNDDDAPPTLRTVAELAGVSIMTVSRALGNQRRIADQTKRKIQTIAKKIGYRPDPELSKLMHHLRVRKRASFQSMLCGVTTRAPGAKEPYSEAVIEGAREQAAQRGYGFMVFSVSPSMSEWRGVQRVLEGRGVQGLLLLPQERPVDLTSLLDWSKFSAVSATSSAIAPAVHRVTPQHFGNALLLCRTLASHGYRRLGLVLRREHDLRVNHLFSAALTWHGLNEASGLVPPLILEGEATAALPRWFKQWKPDAIIGSEEVAVRNYARSLNLKLLGPVALATTSVTPVPISGSGSIGGIDELPAEIGAAAVELLASMVERRVLGLPRSPTATLLAGRWRGDLSCGVR